MKNKIILLNVSTVTFPDYIHGFTIFTKQDDIYNVWINSSLDEDHRAAAFLHECLHIWNEDFDSKDDADHIEQRTHEQMKRISDILISDII